ncbi:MAG: hypothetical protein U0R65_12425 [Candidatus Nanopelagicales bacterium]
MAAEYAPIALFAFRRPDHLAACLAALAACPEAADSPLVVFCDGPRGPQDEEAVREVRAVARAATGFARVDVVERRPTSAWPHRSSTESGGCSPTMSGSSWSRTTSSSHPTSCGT